MTLFETNFTSLDWVIVAVYLVISIFIGIWANRYAGSLSSYLVAGRSLRIRLALATMTGTEIGLVTVMYTAELGFLQQYASLYLALYEMGILLAIGLTGVVVYKLRQTEVMTIPEYYEQRYSQGVRVLGGIMMVVSGVLNMGLFLKAGSLFLISVTGIPDGIGLKLVMTGLLLLVLFYTVLGGMVSVVITDLIQFVVLGIGMILVTCFVMNEIGFDGMARVVTDHKGYVNPIDWDNPSIDGDPDNGIARDEDGIGPLKLLSQAVLLSVALMLWPAGASRTLAVKTPEVAKKLYLLSAIPFLARRTLPVLWGIGAFAFLATHPDLMATFKEQNVSSQAAMPLFLAKIIPTGLLGLVTAGMVAAFMSTHDSYLLCWSGVITQDIIAPIAKSRGIELTQEQRIKTTRIAIVAIGAALLFWGLWYELSSDLWQYMSVTGTIYLAGVLPVVVGGLYWKRASSVGAYLALLSGTLGVLALDPCLEFLNTQLGSSLRSDHMMLTTFGTSLVFFVVGSLAFPGSATTPETNKEQSE
jgi:SSS family solute:Na+ symporter